MSSGDDGDLDCILGESVSDKLVAMTESPQLTTRLLSEPTGHHTTLMNDAGTCSTYGGAATP